MTDCLTRLDLMDWLSSAARCTGTTPEQAASLMVTGAQALLVPLVLLAAILTVWMVRR